MMTTKQPVNLTSEPLSTSVYVGNDLVYLPAFVTSLTPQFIKSIFTEKEIAYCKQFNDPNLRYASTWAAKEAVYKVIKQVDSTIKIWWRTIEIDRTKIQGIPIVSIKNLSFVAKISLTISHDGDYVWALAACLSP